MKQGAKFHFYNNGIKTIRVYAGEEIPEGFVEGRLKQWQVWNKNLTANSNVLVKNNCDKCHNTRKENDNYKAWNKGLTKETDERVLKNTIAFKQCMIEKYGVENPSQLPGYTPWNTGFTKETHEGVKKISESHKGKPTWNKGLTSETDKRVKGTPHTEETKKHLSEIHSSYEMNKRKSETRKRNHSYRTTKAEDTYYTKLLETYSKDDIIRYYNEDPRYPFECDFYIKSEDLFIELNAYWTHGKHPFDENSPEDLKILEVWKEKSKDHPHFITAIDTWTVRDVKKRKIAKENNLNYKMIY